MKTIKILGTFALAILLMCTSCTRDGFLDIEPKGTIIPSKIEDFRLLLDQTETTGGGAFSRGFINKHSNTIYGADHITVTPEIVALNAIERDQLNIYQFRDVIYGPAQSDLDWEIYYKQIFAANIILEGLENVINGTDEEVDALTAEAKLQRAYAYFNLVNIYSEHYDVATADAQLGIPLRNTTALVNVNLERASVKEVYDFIINEIELSIPSLENTQPLDFSFRPSKAGAYGLLAKIFLYQSKYDEALDAVDDALAFYNTLRDINDDEAFEDPFLPTERYWPDVTKDAQIIWHKSLVLDLAVTEAYTDLFAPTDLRSQWFVSLRDRELIDVDGSSLVANQGSFFSGTDGIRTSDLYLIRSECHARLGNIPEANDDLNTLRINRYEDGTYTDIDITDPDELLQFVKDERRREFPMTVERTFDIKRYNRFDNDGITVTHSFNAETTSIAPNSKNWAQPIGFLYINQNPEIQQNPRD